MTLSKKVTTEAISAAKRADIYDLNSWGIDYEIKSLFKNSEYYGKPTVTISNESKFEAYPDQCFWEQNNRNSEWTFYLIGTLRVDVSVDWNEGRSLTSTVELTSVTYPLDTETYEFMREHIPTAEEPPKPKDAEYRVFVYEHPADSLRLPSLSNQESRVIATIETKLHKSIEDDGEEAIKAIIECVSSMNSIPLDNLHAELREIQG
jgi:hypothetical protein